MTEEQIKAWGVFQYENAHYEALLDAAYMVSKLHPVTGRALYSAATIQLRTYVTDSGKACGALGIDPWGAR